jgi:hypothetical protein
VNEGGRFDHLLQLARRHPQRTFRLLTALILTAIAGTVVVRVIDRPSDPVLPVQLRLIHPKLSGLPVQIDRVRSCSCWHGPRDQAQRKYKFRVVNRTDHELNIGGGEHSAIRLIVAYPHRHPPQITMPARSGDSLLRRLPTPNDVDILVRHKSEDVKPTRLPSSDNFFGVPKGYSVWALPALPNKLAEIYDTRYVAKGGVPGIEGETSYPTVVDKTHLLPDEEYEGKSRGHGAWTFYIPIPHRIAQQLKGGGGLEPIFSRDFYERFVIFVGVAALAPGPGGSGRLLGFAPAPSDNALAEPNDL